VFTLHPQLFFKTTGQGQLGTRNLQNKLKFK
jgi:hypothetical protein